MPESVQMWSDEAQAIVEWSVTLVMRKEEDSDIDTDIPDVLMLQHGNEVQRYSPNTTPYELRRYVDTANQAHAAGHSNREEAAQAQEERQDGAV